MILQFSPKRAVFDFTNELIEKLLITFSNGGFCILQNDFRKKGSVVPFAHWPDVTLSDKIVSIEHDFIGINDLLGSYQIKDWSTKEEGTIFIYYETIWDAAGAYLAANQSVTFTQEECFDCLISIVSVHEFVHYIMHSVVGFAPLKYDDEDSKFFHEGFAKLFTWYRIMDLEEGGYQYGGLIVHIFNWLADNQKEAYRKYREIETYGFDGKRIGYSELFKLLLWCKATGLQSFETIKPSLKMIRLDIENREKLPFTDADTDFWVKVYKKNHGSKQFTQKELGEIYYRLCPETIEQYKLKVLHTGRKFNLI